MKSFPVECVLSRNQKLGSEAQRLVLSAIGFIHEHSKPLSGPGSQAFGINEQPLSRCFNKIIGIGPMAYLSRHRILQAKLLDRKNISIAGGVGIGL
jgi:methylphosphotriester-DNA--protein-cysteine methyltransferase